MEPESTPVRTVSRRLCPICNSDGAAVYTNLTDSLLSTPGMWSARICLNIDCKTYWLDPTPVEEDLGRLYPHYTTHTSPEPETVTVRRGARALLDKIRMAVLATELGYKSHTSPFSTMILNTFSKIHPGWRDEKRNQVLYVPFVKSGNLLDVGCGAGHGMETLERYGWKTTGTDFDPLAIANAKSKGFDVYLGELEDQNFAENSFDAVLLSHVIEHVPHPIQLLTECHRVLKPGGHLIVITPNANSAGHRQFGQSWRGLEVPRHLQIFTPQSLTNIGTQAGFRISKGQTCLQGLYYIWDASLAHKKTGSYDLLPKNKFYKIINKFRLFFAGYRFILRPGREETALLYCQK